MDIKTYNKKQLKEALSLNSLWQQAIYPITKQRVLSQIQNPYADDNDPLLLIAYDDDDSQIIGYIGLLPDYISWKNENKKILWATTGWIKPEMKGSGIGAYLFMAAINETQNKYWAVDISDSAMKLYQSLNSIRILPNISGFDFVFFYDINTSNNTTNFLKQKLKQSTIPLINKNQYLKLNYWANKNPINNVHIQYHQYLDSRHQKLINNTFAIRDVDFINWQLQTPWVLEAPVPVADSEKYFFSDFAIVFKYWCLTVFNQNNVPIAFIIFRVRDGFMTMPYLYTNPENYSLIAKIIMHHVVKGGIKSFVTYNQTICSELDDLNIPYLKKKFIYRNVVADKQFVNFQPESVQLQDGLGDSFFT